MTVNAVKAGTEPERSLAIAHTKSRWRDRVLRWLSPSFATSRASYSYRYLARQIELDLPYDRGGRTILISAPGPLELSNETLLMFSYFMHDELGCRILLVDGTFRDRGVGHRLGHRDAPGFLDLVYGNGYRIDELIQPTQRPGIFVLPAGLMPQNQLLPIQTSNLSYLYHEAQGSFDYVLLQQASICADTRYLLFTGKADLILLLIEEGGTLLDELDRCKKVFRDHQISNVRLVLSTPG